MRLSSGLYRAGTTLLTPTPAASWQPGKLSSGTGPPLWGIRQCKPATPSSWSNLTLAWALVWFSLGPVYLPESSRVLGLQEAVCSILGEEVYRELGPLLH